MVHEISISKDLIEYLDGLAQHYHTDGVWIAKLYVKRWDFLVGHKAIRGWNTERFFITEDIALFVENTTEIQVDINDVIERLIQLLNIAD